MISFFPKINNNRCLLNKLCDVQTLIFVWFSTNKVCSEADESLNFNLLTLNQNKQRLKYSSPFQEYNLWLWIVAFNFKCLFCYTYDQENRKFKIRKSLREEKRMNIYIYIDR